MNKKAFCTAVLAITAAFIPGNVFPSSDALPPDFIERVSPLYGAPREFRLSAGGQDGARSGETQLKHYPVIMIAGNRRSFRDWLGENPGNAAGRTNVYAALTRAGFAPEELWLYQYAPGGREMRNMEELTDGFKKFLYSVLWYTRSGKAQILAHGEGAVLAQAAIAKYNLFNLIHAAVYIAAPFHGSPAYSYTQALTGAPVNANLAVDSDFLRDILFPCETPHNADEAGGSRAGVKYMTIYGTPGSDNLFPGDPDSPALLGARNNALRGLDHDGLRCARESRDLFIPFLGDTAIPYDPGSDADKDGFMSAAAGGADCDDRNPSIFPGASEIPDDGIDQDCNCVDISSLPGKDSLVETRR